MENLILFDYLTFTSKVHSVVSVCEFLGLNFNNFERLPNGLYGYQIRYYYHGITILGDGHRPDMGTCVQMSGSGCRFFESESCFSWDDLLFTLYSDNNFNVSRLDIAYDDFTKLLNIDTILNSVDLQLYRSPSRSWTVEYGSEGCCIYIGSKKSDILIRIYDKARERGYDVGEKHWIRLELQLRDDRAFSFLDSLFSGSEYHLGLTFLGVLRRYLCFVLPSSDLNKSRWDIVDWWNSFLCGVSSIRLCSSVGEEYNECKLFNYLSTQPAGALKTYIRIYGLEAINELIVDTKLSPKYQDILKRRGLL